MGPPLKVVLNMSSQEQISEAVQIYRSYYKKKGIQKPNSSPQITELLQELSQNYLSTSLQQRILLLLMI